ncbi:MAG TPA: hypothetical protein VJN94_14660 [Candidatus Binataceae bacterium]|nr:hypothetical protein [Candidatus Binataceae bacterium]
MDCKWSEHRGLWLALIAAAAAMLAFAAGTAKTAAIVTHERPEAVASNRDDNPLSLWVQPPTEGRPR